MSINQSLEKINPIRDLDSKRESISNGARPFYNLLILLSVAVIFFGLGRFSVAKTDGNQIKIGYIQDSQVANVINSMVSTSTVLKEATSSPVSDVSKDGPVIGSKSGKKYYFPWCGTVKRIKPENQVKFNSISDAKKAGFVAGGNCKGLN